jgi:hypothetical protein
MSRAVLILGILILLAIGAVRIWLTLIRLVNERTEVESYIQMFTRYTNSRGADNQSYGELIERSLRVQHLLGSVGIMAQYVAPFGRYSMPNYQIILNGVPAMHRDFGMLTSGRSDHGQLVGETLVRYMGWSADRIGAKQRELRNPIAWLREGVGRTTSLGKISTT